MFFSFVLFIWWHNRLISLSQANKVYKTILFTVSTANDNTCTFVWSNKANLVGKKNHDLPRSSLKQNKKKLHETSTSSALLYLKAMNWELFAQQCSKQNQGHHHMKWCLIKSRCTSYTMNDRKSQQIWCIVCHARPLLMLDMAQNRTYRCLHHTQINWPKHTSWPYWLPAASTTGLTVQ